MRGDWERMRMNATITIQPHLKWKVTPRQVLPLPWGGEPSPLAPRPGESLNPLPVPPAISQPHATTAGK